MGNLTATEVAKALPREKQYNMADGGGLLLIVMPKGQKYWRYRYRFEGLAQMLSLGTYPDVSLKQARDKHLVARQQLASGVNPSTWRKATSIKHESSNSFENITREWHMSRKSRWGEARAKNIITAFEKNIFPWLGNKNIASITGQQFLPCLRRMEERGALHSAHRLLADASRVFRYAVATGRAERDITYDLKGALPPHKKQHFATIIEPEKVGDLLRAIEGLEGSFVVKSALQFLPLVFVRPGELRHAEWSEINWKRAEWVIPAEKMKMKEKHIVPLCKQALSVLEALKPLTGNHAASKYIFPSIRTLQRPMSENTINAALRRMGYTKEDMTGHGFRHMASTLLNQQGFNRDHIERQLAHGDRDQVRASYNFADYMPERRIMMQEWANYLEQLRAGGEVVQLYKRRA